MMSTFPITDWTPEEDPILGLNVAFRKEPRDFKVNLGVGAYKTASGEPLVLASVQQADLALAQAHQDKEYLPIDGHQDYLNKLTKVVFGPLSLADRLYAAQVVGGTGALRIALDYLKMNGPRKAYISDPSWTNHFGICSYAGIEVELYPYYNASTLGLDFDGLTEAIKQMPAGSILLLHACCHNPTGVDPTFAQWQELEELIRKQRVIPFFDCAYQGLGDGLDEDARAIRYFAEQGHDLVVAVSNSKNFGLYGERLGALYVLTSNSSARDQVGNQIRHIIRGSYSSPPLHGPRLVSKLLSDERLHHEWTMELGLMRDRIHAMRNALVEGLLEKSDAPHYEALRAQKGLFSYGALNSNQVAKLRADYAIYMPKSGRINVAGLNQSNLAYVIHALLAVEGI